MLSTYVAASLMRYSGWNAVAIVTLGTASAVLAFAASRRQRRTVRVGVGFAASSVALAVAGALSDERRLSRRRRADRSSSF